jgi:hypothetical protein
VVTVIPRRSTGSGVPHIVRTDRRAGADIRPRPDFGIADIAEVIGFDPAPSRAALTSTNSRIPAALVTPSNRNVGLLSDYVTGAVIPIDGSLGG